jgi:DNA repair protein RadA/Sms
MKTTTKTKRKYTKRNAAFWGTGATKSASTAKVEKAAPAVKRARKAASTSTTEDAPTSMVRKLNIGVTGPQKFSAIDVPDLLRTSVATSWPEIDALFTGEGIRPSTVTLVTGLPGAGKTTLNLQLADKLVALGHTVLVNSCEESGAQLKIKLEKLGLDNLISDGYHASLDEVGEILAEAEKLRALTPKGKQFFLFIDSIQHVEKAQEGRGRRLSEQNQAIAAVCDIASWCKSTMAVAMVIGQVNKDGEFEGRQALKHVIDCHLHLHQDTDRKSETYKQRVAEMLKNRMGGSGLYFVYDINSSGITFQG